MRRLKTLLVLLAAVSLVGLAACSDDDGDGNGNGNGDMMDAAMDTEPEPDTEPDPDTEPEPDAEPDMGEDVKEDTGPTCVPGSTADDDSIREVSDETIEAGASVNLQDVVVTGVSYDYGEDPAVAEEIFVQEPGNDNREFAGISIDLFGAPDTVPERGDLIHVENAQVSDNFGFRHLRTPEGASLNITIECSGAELPDPVVVDPSAIYTGVADADSRIDELMGVLIRVENVQTVNTNPDGPDSDFEEWSVWAQGESPPSEGEGLRVDSLFFNVSDNDPSPESQINYDSIEGPLYWSFGNSKLLPRDADDIKEAGGS